jgi:hypothetical protein
MDVKVYDTHYGLVEVSDTVAGQDPVPFRLGEGALHPSQIRVYCKTTGELTEVVVNGNSVDKNLASKVVYFPHTISLSPKWVWEFVQAACAKAIYVS